MKNVISCSRRTDIPAFHYNWLQERIQEGKVELINSYNNLPYTISLNKEDIHSIVLWSKDYSKFLKDKGLLSNYNLYFHFTINGYGREIEPNTPTIEEAYRQIKELSEQYPNQIMWRFDPIMFTDIETPEKRLEVFKVLAEKFSKLGIKDCTISFLLLYEKVKECLPKYNISYNIVSDNEKIEFVKKLINIAKQNDIKIFTCCEPLLEVIEGINKAHCVDGDRLEFLFGEKISHSKDSGQRLECGCTKSKDIGDYKQKCGHLCRYCYAQKF